jgi:phage-related protein
LADGKVVIDTELNESGMKSGLSSLSKVGGAAVSGIGTALKATTAVIGTATVAVGGLVSASVKAYSSYEQLVGGVDTLFEKSSKKVQQYANDAYKTAGMSANAYMETVTGFSASLLQSLGGDTEKSAEYANSAIVDMSDNANKMGTSMESIKYAYQGFAKQNYTMLDNLKLGYGGTKTEMERLLADASKISGVKYDISSFADVTQAIHVMQTEMGIAGTTAKEASTTIEGSANAMKASWENLLVGISGGGENIDTLINNFKDSVTTFSENILPVISEAVIASGSLIVALLPEILDQIPGLVEQIFPMLIEAGGLIFEAIMEGISSNINGISEGVLGLLTVLSSAFIEAIPQFIDIGLQLVSSLLSGISSNTSSINESFGTMLTSIYESIQEYMPEILQSGVDIVLQLAEGLAEGLPEMIPKVVDLIISLANFIVANIDKIVAVGIKLVVGLVTGLVSAIPELIKAIPDLIIALVGAIIAALPKIASASIEIMKTLGKGLINSIFELTSIVPTIFKKLKEKFATMDWKAVGKSIIESIKKGLSSVVGTLWDVLKDPVGKIKETINGAKNGSSPVTTTKSANSMSQMQNAMTSTLSSMQLSASLYGATNQIATTSGNVQPAPVSIKLVGDADGLFEVVANKNDSYYNRTGYSRFNRG